MEDKKFHFRLIMLYKSRKGISATQCTKNICEVHGEDSIDIRTCHNDGLENSVMKILIYKMNHAKDIVSSSTMTC